MNFGKNTVRNWLAYLSIAVAVGLAVGWCDIHLANEPIPDLPLMAACFFLSIAYPYRFPVTAFILTAGLYIVHVFAIAVLGVEQPYVERDVDTAVWCWFSIILALPGALLGAFWSALGILTSKIGVRVEANNRKGVNR